MRPNENEAYNGKKLTTHRKKEYKSAYFVFFFSLSSKIERETGVCMYFFFVLNFHLIFSLVTGNKQHVLKFLTVIRRHTDSDELTIVISICIVIFFLLLISLRRAQFCEKMAENFCRAKVSWQCTMLPFHFKQTIIS